MRNITAAIITPVLKLTGFRFSKDYRWGVSAWHRFVYRTCNTVQANLNAGM